MWHVRTYQSFYDSCIYHLPPRFAEKAGELISFFPLRAGVRSKKLHTQLFSHTFDNPFILGAGYAHNARMLRGVRNLGAGVVTTKTITPTKRKGNPHPRVFRYPGGLVNHVGLANRGMRAWSYELQKTKDLPVIASIGGDTVFDVETVYTTIAPHASLVELNMSCPNTEHGMFLEEDIVRLCEHKKEVLVKLGPTHNLASIVDALDAHDVGFTLINSYHGMSGKKLYSRTLQALTSAGALTTNPIVSIGGVDHPKKAIELLAHGAHAVGLLTSYITHGPYVFEWFSKTLLAYLEENYFKDVSELIAYAL